MRRTSALRTMAAERTASRESIGTFNGKFNGVGGASCFLVWLPKLSALESHAAPAGISDADQPVPET